MAKDSIGPHTPSSQRLYQGNLDSGADRLGHFGSVDLAV
jgi:hypothetical protein